jgi:hypothetical protein
VQIIEKTHNPYSALPAHAFWRSGVADVGVFGLRDLWASPWVLSANVQFATYGSCFAQHISRALKARKIGWVDGEPAPLGTPANLAQAYNYGVFSARTANIYTAKQLLLLLQMAVGDVASGEPETWETGGRFYDSLRPTIEPRGFISQTEAVLSRRTMLRGLRRSVERADVFVFTLGLTEGWESVATGQPFAACPGTIGGTFDADAHRFVNYRSAAIRADMDAALVILRRLNPGIRMLLTVSPVPLTSTASGGHVLVATTYSKSVLRGVAGEIAQDDLGVDYFPSYEIITGAPSKSVFFEPNLRTVKPQGINLVMGHFFGGLNLNGVATRPVQTGDVYDDAAVTDEMLAEELACEEAMLEIFNAS